MEPFLEVEEIICSTNITKKILWYFIKENLIPRPEKKGLKLYFNKNHAIRIHLVQKLLVLLWPLKTIKIFVNNLSDKKCEYLLNNIDSLTSNIHNKQHEFNRLNS